MLKTAEITPITLFNTTHNNFHCFAVLLIYADTQLVSRLQGQAYHLIYYNNINQFLSILSQYFRFSAVAEDLPLIRASSLNIFISTY